jgi:hypothetical protein
MQPTADIATPDRFRQLGPAWLLMPILLIAAWSIATPHRGPHQHHAATGLAIGR